MPISVVKRSRNRAVFKRGSLSCSCAARSAACVLRASEEGAPARSLSRLTSHHEDVTSPTSIPWLETNLWQFQGQSQVCK